jgi:hypothetical protein
MMAAVAAAAQREAISGANSEERRGHREADEQDYRDCQRAPHVQFQAYAKSDSGRYWSDIIG